MKNISRLSDTDKFSSQKNKFKNFIFILFFSDNKWSLNVQGKKSGSQKLSRLSICEGLSSQKKKTIFKNFKIVISDDFSSLKVYFLRRLMWSLKASSLKDCFVVVLATQFTKNLMKTIRKRITFKVSSQFLVNREAGPH